MANLTVRRNDEVARLLGEIRQHESAFGPGATHPLAQTWDELHQTWWTVALQVQAAEDEVAAQEDRVPANLLDWPRWIREQLSDDSLRLCLEAVFRSA